MMCYSKGMNHCDPKANHQPGDCVICDYYTTQIAAKRTFPHCDAYAVHAPGFCEYCDDYAADMQNWRMQNNVNYTGWEDPTRLPCPATTRRSPEQIHRWYGNAPQPKPQRCKRCLADAVFVNLALACPNGHGPI